MVHEAHAWLSLHLEFSISFFPFLLHGYTELSQLYHSNKVKKDASIQRPTIRRLWILNWQTERALGKCLFHCTSYSQIWQMLSSGLFLILVNSSSALSWLYISVPPTKKGEFYWEFVSWIDSTIANCLNILIMKDKMHIKSSYYQALQAVIWPCMYLASRITRSDK